MVQKMDLMKKSIGVGATLVLVSIGVAAVPAHANVIAVSLDNVTNYQFAAPPGGLSVLESPGQTTSNDSASYNAATSTNSASCNPGAGPCNPGGLSANALQATAGPGSFPGEDNFTKPPAGGFVGSRGDANVTSVSFNVPPSGAGAANVAESRLNSPSTGGAFGDNLIVTNLTIQGASTQTTTLDFSFVADPYMQVAVDKAGDIATAVLGMQISLVDANNTTVFLWSPGVSSGEIGVASETNPFSLNQTLSATTPADNQIFNPSSDTFRATTAALSPGNYTLNFQTSETVRAAQSQSVPEPSTILLFPSALLAVIGITCRNYRRKQIGSTAG